MAVSRLNAYLSDGVSIDITPIDLAPIKDELRVELADRLSETGVSVNPNDPVINSIISRYAERLNELFQVEGLQIDEYIWRSRDDERVRSAHAANEDQVFSWSDPPEGGHPGQPWSCRCNAEPVLDLAEIPEGAVCDILTGDRLLAVFPDADEAKLAALAREIDLQIVTGQLDSPERLAHFFGQVLQEVGTRLRLVENLDYSPDSLGATFRYFRRHPQEAELFGRTSQHPADQQAIANRAYANRNGNGDIASGDGWRFRGRGLKQLTGRANYREFTADHELLFGENADFEEEPDLLGTPEYAVRSALFFWRSNGLHLLADGGITQAIANSITSVINLETDSYTERWHNTRDLDQTGIFENICSFSVSRPRFEDAE